MISRRKFLLFLLGLFGVSSFSYGFYERKKFKVEKLNFPSEKWAGDPLKIIFLTDLHRGPFTGIEFIEKISEVILNLKPELLIFGGDYIYASINYLKDALQPFKDLNPLYGKWGVLGNHDNYLGRKKVISNLKENKIELLNNSSIKLISGKNIFYLFGIDDYKTGSPDMEKASKYLKEDGFILGISHNPLLWNKKNLKIKVDLLLSGHTHGGQIDLPFFGPIFLLPGHGREFYKGLYNLNGKKLYVSRGIGTIHVPLRIFCPPEITLINVLEKN